MITDETELGRVSVFLMDKGLIRFKRRLVNSASIHSLDDMMDLDEEGIKACGIYDEADIDEILMATGKKSDDREERKLRNIEEKLIERGIPRETVDLLRSEEVFTERMLRSLTEEDLRSIGIEKLGERKRLLEAIEAVLPSSGQNTHNTSDRREGNPGGYTGSRRGAYYNTGGAYYNSSRPDGDVGNYGKRSNIPPRYREEEGGCLWWFLGFICPFPVDIIIWLVLKNERPRSAHDWGWGMVWSYLGAFLLMLSTCFTAIL